MKTNKCHSCGAHNTLKSKECFNCGADISKKGHFKSMVMSIIVMVILLYIFGGGVQ